MIFKVTVRSKVKKVNTINLNIFNNFYIDPCIFLVAESESGLRFAVWLIIMSQWYFKYPLYFYITLFKGQNIIFHKVYYSSVIVNPLNIQFSCRHSQRTIICHSMSTIKCVMYFCTIFCTVHCCPFNEMCQLLNMDSNCDRVTFCTPHSAF